MKIYLYFLFYCCLFPCSVESMSFRNVEPRSAKDPLQQWWSCFKTRGWSEVHLLMMVKQEDAADLDHILFYFCCCYFKKGLFFFGLAPLFYLWPLGAPVSIRYPYHQFFERHFLVFWHSSRDSFPESWANSQKKFHLLKELQWFQCSYFTANCPVLQLNK